MLHPLTTEELEMLLEAWGDGKNPRETRNPNVDFAIHCLKENAQAKLESASEEESKS